MRIKHGVDGNIIYWKAAKHQKGHWKQALLLLEKYLPPGALSDEGKTDVSNMISMTKGGGVEFEIPTAFRTGDHVYTCDELSVTWWTNPEDGLRYIEWDVHCSTQEVELEDPYLTP